MNAHTLTTAQLRRLMGTAGSKALRRSSPVLLYAGPKGYAVATTGAGAWAYAGEAEAVAMAARGQLAASLCMTGARADALLSAGGGLAELIAAADATGGTPAPTPLDMTGARSMQLGAADRDAFAWAALAADVKGNGGRVILSCVAFELVEGSLRCVAADNYRLHVAGGGGLGLRERAALVPAILAPFITGGRMTRASWYGTAADTSSVLIEGDGVAVKADTVHAPLPWASVLPQGDVVAQATAEAFAVRDANRDASQAYALAEAAKGSKAGAARVTLAVGPGGLVLGAGAGLGNAWAREMQGASSAIVNAEYVRDAVSDHGGAVVVKLYGDGYPVTVQLVGGNGLAVIMPLRGAPLDEAAVQAAATGELVTASA